MVSGTYSLFLCIKAHNITKTAYVATNSVLKLLIGVRKIKSVTSDKSIIHVAKTQNI